MTALEYQIRVGQPQEAQAAAALLYDSDPPYYDFWLGSRELALTMLAELWQQPQGAYRAANMQLVHDDIGLAALFSAYPAEFEHTLAQPSEAALKSVSVDAIAMSQRENQLAYLFPRIPDDAWYLRTLAVAAERRGKGLGGQLLHLIEQQAQDQGYSLLLTDVDSGNPGAVRFYQHAGYEILVETKVTRLSAHRLPTSLRMAKYLNQDS